MRIGIDFGTTNSAVAVLDGAGEARILPLFDDQPVQRTVIHAGLDGITRFGNAAFQSYLNDDLQGRFVRSLKAFLPQEVPRTTLGRRRYALPEMISLYLKFLLRRTEELLGEAVTQVVVGRPVVFHMDPEKDEFARRQLEGAVEAAGLPGVRCELEPVAAARRFEATLSEDRVLLVGDFGGGTADFAVLQVGPSRDPNDPTAGVLGVSGVDRAGDALDTRFMDAFLMPYFGAGVPWTCPRTGRTEPWNAPVLREVQRLFYIPLLREPGLERLLDRVEPQIADPVGVRRLRRLVFEDLGFPLAWAIEGCKRGFSESETTDFQFDEFHHPQLDFGRTVSRSGLARAASQQLDAYRKAIGEALDRAGMAAGDIDDVFLTGGTSQLPFVRQLFAEAIGEHKLHEANALTSVCEGLALSAG